MPARFSSTETIEWNQGAFDDGYECRMHSADVLFRDANNPYKDLGASNWMYKSFVAGWADADIDPDAPWNRSENE